MIVGSLSPATMFALIAALPVNHGLVPTYGWSTLGAFAANGLALIVVQRPWRRPA